MSNTIKPESICENCGKEYRDHDYISENCPHPDPMSNEWLSTTFKPKEDMKEEKKGMVFAQSSTNPLYQPDRTYTESEVKEFAKFAWIEWEKLRNDPRIITVDEILEKFKSK